MKNVALTIPCDGCGRDLLVDLIRLTNNANRDFILEIFSIDCTQEDCEKGRYAPVDAYSLIYWKDEYQPSIPEMGGFDVYDMYFSQKSKYEENQATTKNYFHCFEYLDSPELIRDELRLAIPKLSTRGVNNGTHLLYQLRSHSL